jgi:hypothetical protein
VNEVHWPLRTRPIHNFDSVIEQLDNVEASELTDAETESIFSFESALYDNRLPVDEFLHVASLVDDLKRYGESLPLFEDVWRKKINSNNFGLGYFLTPEGRQAYAELFGSEIDARTANEVDEELRKQQLATFASDDLNELEKNSVDYEEERVVREFADNGYKDVSGIDEPKIITVYKNPEVILEKAKGYRLLKKYVKLTRQDLDESIGDNPEVRQAKLLVLDIYQQRINVFIANLYPHAFALLAQYRSVGDEHTVRLLEELQDYLPALYASAPDDRISKFLQTLDRFTNGADYDKEGNLSPIDSGLAEDAIAKEEEYQSDSEPKTQDKKLSAEEIRDLIVEMLSQWDLLSREQDYDTDREVRAPDGKWQAPISGKFKSLSVSGQQSAAKVPDKSRGRNNVLPVLSHEMAHVWQHENKRRAGRLALMQEIGIDNNLVFAEAGGKWWEKEARERLLGVADNDIAGTSYLAAIKARLNGGDFMQCMVAFFEDFHRREPDMQLEDAAKRAVNRTRRIFSKGGEFVKDTTYLTNSQPLNYLEQVLVLQKLPEEKRKLLLLGGVSIPSALELARVGLLKLSEIQVPDKKPWDILA